jgi:hypothetical protein
MKTATDVGQDATIYITNFIKTGSGIQKLLQEDTDTETAR